MSARRVAIVFTLLALVTFAGGHRLRAENAAVVNGAVITAEEVENVLRRSGTAKTALSDQERQTHRRQILDMLIEEALVNQYLDQQKVAIAPEKVEEHVAQLRRQLAEEGKTLADFLTAMGTDEARMRADIKNIYRWIAFVDGRASEKSLRSYFAANQVAFDGSQVRASHILVKVAPKADQSVRTAARRKIDAIRQEVLAGTPFADAARRYSDCPSKEMGGDLGGPFPRKGVMTEPFAAAAFALPVGQLSDVVETEFGYHLILVSERQPGKPVVYEEVTDQVKEFYALDLRQAIVARMQQNAQIKILR